MESIIAVIAAVLVVGGTAAGVVSSLNSSDDARTPANAPSVASTVVPYGDR